MVYKSSITVDLVRQFTEEIQMATAHVKRKKKKHLTTLITQETEVKSQALFPSDINKDRADLSNNLSTQRAKGRAFTLHSQ